MPETRKYNRIILLICLCTSFLVMMICTKASFLYPLQDWCDDNILFTIGRGVLDGKVIYRDLYDHKGPLTYIIYAACAVFSSKSFIGLYIIESIAFGGFLYFSWKTISLFDKRKITILTIPVLAALTASANGFNFGGSVEELVLPFLAYGLYSVLKFFLDEEDAAISRKSVILNGAFAGCIFWIKFSMLGFHLGWIISLFLIFLIRKKAKDAFKTVGYFLIGMIIPCVPVFLYFCINRSLPFLVNDYFVKNIFGYASGTEISIISTLRNIRMGTIHSFKMNFQYSLLIFIGFVYLMVTKKNRITMLAKIALLLMIAFTCVGAFCREYVLKYYGNLLMTFACLGFIPILRLDSKEKELTLISQVVSYTGFTIFSLVLCYCLSLSSYMIGWSREQLPQYRFAEKMSESKMEENITLLSYDMMDSGFYLASESEPVVRFFTSTNYASPELIEGQNEALNQGSCEFIVTMNEELSHPLYRQIDSASYYYEQDMQTYYLYQRI